MADQTDGEFGAFGGVVPTRRLVPVYLAPPVQLTTGVAISSVAHGILLAALIISAASLFGRERDIFQFPVAIQFLGKPDAEQNARKEEQLPDIDLKEKDDKAKKAEKKLVAGSVEGESETGEGADTTPEISMPDVREGAIASAKLKERPKDSGAVVEASQPGGVSVVYDRGEPLTKAEESGGRLPEALEALPQVSTATANPAAEKAEETLAEKFRKQAGLDKPDLTDLARQKEIEKLAEAAANAQPDRAAEIADLQSRALAGDPAAQKQLAALAKLEATESDREKAEAARRQKEIDARKKRVAKKRTEKWKRHLEKTGASRKITEAQQQDLNKALGKAISSGNIQRIETLLQAGANPYAVDAAGKDAIIAASWRGRELVVAFLLEQGIDVETADNSGRTPLAWAAINGYDDIVRELLRVDANPNSVDYRGLTPLMRAAWNGHYKVVKILVRGGADVFLTDREGKTALDRAEEERWPRVVKFLTNHIARIEQN